jgi:hypothetical protein
VSTELTYLIVVNQLGNISTLIFMWPKSFYLLRYTEQFSFTIITWHLSSPLIALQVCLEGQEQANHFLNGSSWPCEEYDRLGWNVR